MMGSPNSKKDWWSWDREYREREKQRNRERIAFYVGLFAWGVFVGMVICGLMG